MSETKLPLPARFTENKRFEVSQNDSIPDFGSSLDLFARAVRFHYRDCA